jgi:nucleosome binding factor SPN SPT16 subunit
MGGQALPVCSFSSKAPQIRHKSHMVKDRCFSKIAIFIVASGGKVNFMAWHCEVVHKGVPQRCAVCVDITNDMLVHSAC